MRKTPNILNCPISFNQRYWSLATLAESSCFIYVKILVTGANGYIGMRLIPALLESRHKVICCVRNKSRLPINKDYHENISVVEGDFLKPDTLKNLPGDIDVAYFLIHSMNSSTGNFKHLETKTAENFKDYVDRTAAARIVYLSGIVNSDELSEHLESRLNVEKILKKSKASLTVLRAGIIVGSGSASFEIIRDLVEKLPVMIAPKWLKTKSQPIAIRDVIGFLSEVINLDETKDKVYDIGGPDILSYKDMLLQFAEVRNLRRTILTVPVLTPRLSSLWLYFVTATSYNLARNLVDSMKVDVIAKPNDLANKLGIKPITYKKAVELAFQRIKQNLVTSSWKDSVVASDDEVSEIEKFIEVPTHGCLKDVKKKEITGSVDRVTDNIWSIGGDKGWYYGTYLWKIRGYLDKLFGGIGLRRGRRSPTDLNPGDALDFWRVIVANKNQRRLLLFAEMKLPGEAWLEFNITEENGIYYLNQTATFRPKGLWGRLYWYSVWPFHIFVFEGMARRIANN